MARRPDTEAFQHYGRYLDQVTSWPSESNGELVPIETMAARYAISAHGKLLRWSQTMAAHAQLNIYDPADREHYVRSSPLAQALMRRAQNLPATEIVEAAEVTPRDIILAFAPVVAENTNLDITAIFKLCEALATMADEEWTITVQSQ